MSDTQPASPAESDKTTAKKTTAKKAAKKAPAKKAARKAAKKTTTLAKKKVAKKVAAAAPTNESRPTSSATETNKISEPKTPPPAPQETPSSPPTEQAQQEKPQQEKPQQEKPQNGRVKNYNKIRNKNNNRGRQNNNGNRNKNRNRNNRGRQNNNRNNNNRDKKPQKIELTGPAVKVNGMLEMAPKGFGFLRDLKSGLDQASDDVFVTPDVIRTIGLREGVWIHGEAMQGPRGLQLTSVESINGKTPEQARKLPHFEELKAINPNKRIVFETRADRFTTRVLDIIAPVGRGQRGLIVSPPRSGKTTLMMHMAEAVKEKYDDSMHLIVLLIDERPEEVTEFKLSLPDAEIFASSNDAGAKNHCRVAELCIERAKRLVEAGEHVFILMDSITRLARAYNTALGGNKKGRGRGIQSGGIITGALEMPRRLFAAARNTRTAGSLTIIATALVHTNSRSDDAIFQEFKGTGNMELVLDRRIAEQYIYPAVDIFKSGTRREELLLPEIQLHKIHLIRRGLAGHRPEEAMERLQFFLKRFESNAQMLIEIKG